MADISTTITSITTSAAASTAPGAAGARPLLIHQADLVATFDDQRRELRGASVLVRGPAIAAIYPAGSVPPEVLDEVRQGGEVIDARGHVVIPGLVNTHHHMFQSLTRAVPAAQDAELFTWLRTLYPIWARLTPEMIAVSTQVAMAELLLSGCTTSSDHLYIYPDGCTLDHSIEAAKGMGLRFHAARGSMSVGESQGGLPPDSLVEREPDILKDTQRLIDTHHDQGRYAMLRLVVAPCSPFSVSEGLMKDSAALARSYGAGASGPSGVRLHTHLAENDHDIAYSHTKFNKTPTDYAESLGWLGDDVWHAHCVKLDAHGISRFAATRTGVAHCPCSNMRLASGIAPVRRMLDAGVPVGLGVDGSASNDAGHLLAEARQALLLARVGRALAPPETDASGRTVYGCDLGPAEMSARHVLDIATRGGAAVLGRDDIGQLAPGMAADLALFRVDQHAGLAGLGYAGGAVHDPLAALLFCHASHAACTIVNGRVLVRGGELVGHELAVLVERHNRLARQLVGG
jgi:cytosine/adenosine deaminase-related metal-dependent hydrolase